MLLKILGGLDIIIALILIILGSGIEVPTKIIFIIAIILLLKASLGFFKDIGSWIDSASALILVISSIINIPGLIIIIIGLIIAQKGIFSFL